MIPDRLRAVFRFTLVTLALAGVYLLLQHFWMGLAGWGQDWLQERGQPSLSQQAADVRERSRAAEARLPPERRVQAFRLGFEMGFLAQSLGSVALSDEPARQQMESSVLPRADHADRLAEEMGLGPAHWPRVETLAQFVRLQERFEVDEGGLAARIEARLSPRHRELYLVGVHTGINEVAVRATVEAFNDLSVRLMTQHATRASLPPAAFEALTRPPVGSSAEKRLEARRAALRALEVAIAADPAASN